jgi:hypothetical protein
MSKKAVFTVHIALFAPKRRDMEILPHFLFSIWFFFALKKRLLPCFRVLFPVYPFQYQVIGVVRPLFAPFGHLTKNSSFPHQILTIPLLYYL